MRFTVPCCNNDFLGKVMSKFIYHRRVEFADTDMAGMVHFSSYFCFLEEAEHHFLRSLGFSVMMQKDGKHYGMPRVSAQMDFTKPVKFEDVLEIHVTVEKVGNTSVAYLGEFFLQDQLVAKGRMVSVLCEMSRDCPAKTIPIPDWMRQKLLGGS